MRWWVTIIYSIYIYAIYAGFITISSWFQTYPTIIPVETRREQDPELKMGQLEPVIPELIEAGVAENTIGKP